MKQTNAMWYLVALFLVLGGWVAAAAIAAGDWEDLKHADVTPINSGKKIDVSEKGVAFFTDFKQDRKVSCRSTPVKALEIKEATFDLQTESGDRIWHMIGTARDPKPGAYDVACTPRDKASDTATYGFAVLPDSDSTSTGLGVSSIATAAGLILTAWCWWGRRTQRKLATT